MKQGVLRSVAHNISASLASGIGILVGVYDMDVFGEAVRSAEGFITVDFLSGDTSGALPSRSLARAISLYKNELPRFCAKHGVLPGSFKELTTRYSMNHLGPHYEVTVTDRLGRRNVTDYWGYGGGRALILDSQGRIRPKPVRKFGKA